MNKENSPEAEQATPQPDTTNDPNPDIAPLEVEYVINTYDPEIVGGETILNEQKP